MFFKQKVFAILAAVVLLVLIVELVRRRKMREEYSFLWILTGVSILILTIWYDLLLFFTELIGAVLPTTTLFLLGVMFLVLISIHFSVKSSRFTFQIEDLSQKLAILEEKIDRCLKEKK